MFKKVITLLLVVVLTAAIAVGGTLAYLTDRDSEVNVFTVGNVEIDLTEDFEQGSTLIPGVDIEKKPAITNTGSNDAWVWATIAIPANLDDSNSASKNVIHFNYNSEDVNETEWTWQGNGDWMIESEDIHGVKYNVYTVLYQTALKPEAVTSPVMTKVYLDTHIDIDPEGNWAWVENGVVTDLEWNSNTDGNPMIYVSAYAAQTDGFATVLDAYNAYQAQWGDKGTEYPIAVLDAEDFEAALTTGGKVQMEADVSGDSHTIADTADVTIELNDNTLSGTIINNGDVTVTGGTLESDAAGIENSGNATFTDVTMNAGSPADYSNIASADSTTVYNNVTIVSEGGGIGAVDGAKVVFNSGSVAVNSASTSGRYIFYAVGEGTEVTINDGEFSFSKTLNQKRAYIYVGSGATVYVKGGNFGPASTRSDYTAGILTSSGGQVIITGGTFGFDPSAWVADGYKAVETDNGWVVSAK